MIKGRYLYRAALVSACLLLWAAFSWPLPQYFSSGIPSSDRNVEKNSVRFMIPGDHLQLMYHFWLASDMLQKETPAFSNIYEFNTGDDASLYHFDPYYAPYSLAFALLNTLFSRAAAWNAAGILSVLCSFAATYLLVKRMSSSNFAATAAAVLASAFPYRWITLLTGSPTGFGISMVPVTVLGLHMAVCGKSWRGGIIAGLGVLFSYTSDLHVFYFNTISVPFWIAAFATLSDDISLKVPRTWLRPSVALIPTAALSVSSAAIGLLAGTKLQATDMASGRDWSTIIKYSARSRGLFSWDNLGMSNHVFLGYSAALLLTVIITAMIFLAWKKRVQARTLIFSAALFLALFGIINTALGANGIADGIMMKACRRIIPKFTMIRQAAKLFCLVPVFLPLMTGLTAALLLRTSARKTGVYILFSVLTLACIAEWRLQVAPSICLLADSEPAYSAVSKDAAEAGSEARAVAVPLWPGDSHWSSIYEHYSSLYRIRMLNGYSPAIGKEYFDSVFMPLQSINLGVLSSNQAAILKSMRVNYLIFHEDAFPEQVSPYPAYNTLTGFLNNPNLQLIHQSESIWAFKMLDEPVPAAVRSSVSTGYIFSTRGWEMENVLKDYGEMVEDTEASGSAIRLTADRASVRSRQAPSAPGQRLCIRIKGEGSFAWEVLADSTAAGKGKTESSGDKWHWISLPFETGSGAAFDLALNISDPVGSILMDVMFLCAGEKIAPEPGATVEIPAASFFRAGYTALPNLTANFRMMKDPDRMIMYSLLPELPEGRYMISVSCHSTSAASPGALNLAPHNSPPRSILIPAMNPDENGIFSGIFTIDYEHLQNLPLRLGLVYSREADISVKSVLIHRVE